MTRLLLPLLPLCMIFAALVAACPGGECSCNVCLAGQAVTLSVTDEDGTPLTDWVADATVDGEDVPGMEACEPDTRVTNTCSLGDQLGVYRIVVRAPGFEDKEAAARVAVPSGQNCCFDPCVPNTLVTVKLRPLEN